MTIDHPNLNVFGIWAPIVFWILSRCRWDLNNWNVQFKGHMSFFQIIVWRVIFLMSKMVPARLLMTWLPDIRSPKSLVVILFGSSCNIVSVLFFQPATTGNDNSSECRKPPPVNFIFANHNIWNFGLNPLKKFVEFSCVHIVNKLR